MSSSDAIFEACGYVADKIGRLVKGKNKDEEVKGVTERKCVLSGNKMDNGYAKEPEAVVPAEKAPVPYRDSPPPPYEKVVR